MLMVSCNCVCPHYNLSTFLNLYRCHTKVSVAIHVTVAAMHMSVTSADHILQNLKADWSIVVPSGKDNMSHTILLPCGKDGKAHTSF